MEPYLQLHGRRIEVAWHSPAPDEAPTLVFLHPGMGSASTWREFPREIARATGCGAMVYSRPGHGGSDAETDPLPLDHMQLEGEIDLPLIVEAAGLREFVLIGHSNGGSIALVYAGREPHPGLRGVVTLAAHVFCEEETARSAEAAKEDYESGSLRERLALHHGAKTDWVFRTWHQVWTDPRFMEWNLESYLPGIEVPLLVIQGADDPYGTRRQVDAILAGAGAETEELWLPDSGHASHRDRKDEVSAAIVSFVRRVTGR